MSTKHTIQKRVDAEIGVVIHTGGDQRDPYPIAVSFTAAWES